MTSLQGSEPTGSAAQESLRIEQRCVGRIPLRNIWLLMLYAADIARYKGRFQAAVEPDLSNLPDLVGRLLVKEVNRRIRRNLTRGYRHREAVLNRVRGRILPLQTLSHRLMDRGEVACRVDELTIDTPRNRFVRAALDRLWRMIDNDALALRCRSLAHELGQAGVSGDIPTRSDLAKDHIGRNDVEDRFLMALAKLAFNLALPTEDAGTTPFTSPEREEHWVRHLFERAVVGFYASELEPMGWRVRSGQKLDWEITDATAGIQQILPSMKTDIILSAPNGQLIVMDTKFTGIVTKGWFREETIKSGYLYQIYAYLRSQERLEDATSPWNSSTGILLHPAINRDLDESVTIQGHRLRFVTVDLSISPGSIRHRLGSIICESAC